MLAILLKGTKTLYFKSSTHPKSPNYTAVAAVRWSSQHYHFEDITLKYSYVCYECWFQ